MGIRKNCAKCKFHAKLEKWNYVKDGVDHTTQKGFLCTALLFDNVGVWITGVDDLQEYCDLFTERGKDGNDRACKNK